MILVASDSRLDETGHLATSTLPSMAVELGTSRPFLCFILAVLFSVNPSEILKVKEEGRGFE